MARYKITSPDGKRTATVEGPDDPTDQELHELTQAAFGDAYKANPLDTSGVTRSALSPAAEASLAGDLGTGAAELVKGVGEGAANVLDHTADWVQGGLNVAGRAIAGSNWGDNLNSIWGDGTNELAKHIAPAQAGFEVPRGVGKFAGEVAATLPIAALPGGALTQGAIGGGLLSDGINNAGVGAGAVQVAKDAALGGLLSKGGEAVLRGGASLAMPATVPDSIRTLMNAGVRVEPGQVARAAGTKSGDRFANWVDNATSSPFVGPRVVENRSAGFEDFGRATINRAVEPIGAALPESMKVGRKAVEWAGNKLSNAYNALLPNLRVRGDGEFVQGLQQIHGDAAMLAPDKVRQFETTLKGLGRFWNGGQELSGAALKQIDERLAERVSRFSKSALADDQDLGDAFQAIRDLVHEAAARQNPKYAGELQAINKGWKGLVQVEKASGNSKGSISPAGYSQAVKASSDTTRRRGYSRGQALNQDLADAGSEVLPSGTPDSGTAGRWQQSNKQARLQGGIDLLRYRAAEALQPTMLRQSNLHPDLARLLSYGAKTSPYVAAPLLSTTLQP